MMTIETVKKADALINKRNRIVMAKWPELKGETMHGHGLFSASENISLPVDEPLALAIEEFRKRKRDAIDAELRELGVEPPQMIEAEAATEEPTRLSRVRV